MSARGFTLVELLIAISIIAVLSTVGFAIFSNANIKARDTDRKNDLKQIQTALELYYEDTGKYPEVSSGECTTLTKDSLQDAKFYQYLKDVPNDPSDNTKYYNYCYDPGTNTYKLSAVLEEKCGDNSCEYELEADDAFIAQTPNVPEATIINPTVLPSPSPSGFTRPTNISLPPTCNGMSIRPRSSLGWIGDGSTHDIKVKPFVTDWSKVSKVDIYIYQDPIRSMNHPYESSKWRFLGSTNNSVSTVDGPMIPGGSEDNPLSFYTGRYVARMDVFDKTGKKTAGWNTEFDGRCLQDFTVEPNPNKVCEADNVVEPRNLTAYRIGNDILLKWMVYNYQGQSGDTFYAYRSTEPGFSIDPSKRVISSFKPPIQGANQLINNVYHTEETYFFRMSAFNEGGETASNEQVVDNLPREKRSCSGTIFGPPSATAAPSQYEPGIRWSYYPAFANWWGWYVIGDNNYKFQVNQNELVNVSWCYIFGGPYCVAWRMPYTIPGSYKVQAFGECDRLGSQSGVAATYTTSGEDPDVSLPDSPPTNITVNIPDNGVSEIISWRSTSTNTKGFNVYRDTQPFDMNKAVTTNDVNSFLREAYFENVPAGQHYFAVKEQNQCGSGWSQILPVTIQ